MPPTLYTIARDTARSLLPISIYDRIKWWRWSRPKPDRRYLQQNILPTLASLKPGRVLFVGTQGYTQHYRSFFQPGLLAKSTSMPPCDYWTMDFDPAAAEFGSPGCHVIGSVIEVDKYFAPASIDIVLLNGVFGFGVDDPKDQAQTLSAVHKILRPDGVLLLGWNQDLVADPLGVAGVIPGFTHASIAKLPARKQFADSTHVFDFFRTKVDARG